MDQYQKFSMLKSNNKCGNKVYSHKEEHACYSLSTDFRQPCTENMATNYIRHFKNMSESGHILLHVSNPMLSDTDNILWVPTLNAGLGSWVGTEC